MIRGLFWFWDGGGTPAQLRPGPTVGVGIEALYVCHTKPLQRKYPAHIQRMLMRDIEKRQREERRNKRMARMAGGGAVNSSRSLLSKGA